LAGLVVALPLGSFAGTAHQHRSPFWVRDNVVCTESTQDNCFMPAKSKMNRLGHHAYWQHWTVQGSILCMFVVNRHYVMADTCINP
jgi:hypothetical protein